MSAGASYHILGPRATLNFKALNNVSLTSLLERKFASFFLK